MQHRWMESPFILVSIAVALLIGLVLCSWWAVRTRIKYQRLRELIQSHNKTVNALVHQDSLEHQLHGICQLIESQVDGAKCTIMTLDEKTHTLSSTASLSLPQDFLNAIDGIPATEGSGACGTAAATGQAVLVSDMRQDTRFDRFQALIEKHGVIACWSHPIFHTVDHRILGTFAVYFKTPRKPQRHELKLIAGSRDLVALIMERDQRRRKQLRLEHEYRVNDEKLKVFRSGVHASADGVVISDAEQPGFPVIYVNPAFEKMTGYSFSEMDGKSCKLLQGPDTNPDVLTELNAALREKREIKTVVRNYRKDGTMFWNELLISPVKGASGEVTHFIGLQSDITERIQREEALEFYATHDNLTGLANRNAMEQRLCAVEADSDENIFVLFIDLDGFKPVNDSLGHYLGDEVLIETARRLQDVICEPNLLSRFGGDEFVAVIENVNAVEQVNALCSDILAVFEHPFVIGDVEVSLSAAIGIAANDRGYKHAMELTQRADIAMYEAKKRGGNLACWYSVSLEDGLGYRVALRTKIQEALSHNQFELFYQPIMTRAGTVSGVEALIRWNRPGDGYVSPADFIPVAERTGQIILISDWVLEQACKDMQQLKQFGIKTVAVNFSPIQFYRDDFVSKIRATLDRHEIKPGELTVEITENVLMNDTQRIADLLRELRELGMNVAIDDFGSGFASLRYLNMLPVNKLKIDRSFIEKIDQNPYNAAITRGIVKMVSDIEIDIVAEGVETESEYEYLINSGCQLFQGFLFSRPQPLDDLLGWAERQQSLENER